MQNILKGQAQFVTVAPQCTQSILTVNWNPALGTVTKPCFGTDPGAVPDNDNYAGTPLTISKSGDNILLNWSAPGGTCITDNYGVYRGTLPFTGYDHAYITCDTGNSTSYTVSQDTGSYYFLVVAQSSGSEGLYGLDSLNNPIPPAVVPCLSQTIGDCN